MPTTLVAPKEALIAVIGNPNTGKTTLFNKLTGKRQRVGNYPGITVEKKTGRLEISGRQINLVDLPGAYSLAATSPDERVAVDVLTGNSDLPTPDLVVCVADAANLQRNLFLAMQVADFGLPMVLALNMTDEAGKLGIEIDVDKLSAKLGIPVVPMVAVKSQGLDQLKLAISAALERPQIPLTVNWPAGVTDALDTLEAGLANGEGEPLTHAELRRILFDADSALLERTGVHKDKIRPLLAAAREHLFKAGMNPLAAEALIVYKHLGSLLADVEQHHDTGKVPFSDKLDRVLTHRVWGLLIFLGVMYVVFQSIYAWASPFMDAIEWLTKLVQEPVSAWLASSPVLQSLFADGVIAGVGGMLVFLPQILILFFFIALLEDSGYMARAAFLMDKLFSWCGLNGKSFVPMLSGFACGIPAVMATRTIEDRKSRLTTILIAPLMSCSARLPVYVIMIGAFIEPHYGAKWAGFTLFAMHLLGLTIALPLAWFFTKFMFKGKSQPFLLELPPYRWPAPLNVIWRMWERGGQFVKRAGTIIFAMSVLIWALCYFPRPESVEEQAKQEVVQSEQAKGSTLTAIDEQLAKADSPLALALEHETASAYLEQSYMGRAGKFIQPLFAPAGFDWKITVGVLASFPAREVIISTLGIIYNLGTDVDEESDDLKSRMASEHWTSGPLKGRPVFNVPIALAIMVFFALCMQCGATVAIVIREAGLKWGIFSFAYMTVLAWIGSVLIYQIGMRIFA
ncbi:MAG: ferrous iron transport protein B [Verrucomicrobiales bacterium]|jgi:ferrous iron transport protein B|nr:ferrous iron transport protein B [Verrucomicrobiales bacterium]